MSTHRHYATPTQCPTCHSRLHVNGLRCDTCDTEVRGHFSTCEFCSLDDDQRGLLRVFLASRGNAKELERHLGVSYPTARARLDDLLAALDITRRPPPRRSPRAGVRSSPHSHRATSTSMPPWHGSNTQPTDPAA